jgi:hypothetical protein
MNEAVVGNMAVMAQAERQATVIATDLLRLIAGPVAYPRISPGLCQPFSSQPVRRSMRKSAQADKHALDMADMIEATQDDEATCSERLPPT